MNEQAKNSIIQNEEFIEDKYFNDGDTVDFIDAEGCFVSKAKIMGVRENLALIQLRILPSRPFVVRTSDLLKLKRKD